MDLQDSAELDSPQHVCPGFSRAGYSQLGSPGFSGAGYSPAWISRILPIWIVLSMDVQDSAELDIPSLDLQDSAVLDIPQHGSPGYSRAG
ncbi:hypothetical protein scyTo_0027400 [Scyliorhinus torazame]|uniref:Uncharacterized protein n=1 Tax=Scyliorhinus torazame TaxID=75743 RepID=A0A401QMX0_SCYTO|nr:hypothetical protein [Scyliorhinus torazame]